MSIPYRLAVSPQTVEIMKEIRRACHHVAPLDTSIDEMVLKNEFLLCHWEFDNTLLQRDRIEIVYRCPMKAKMGIVSSFEEKLIRLLADGEGDGSVRFITRRGSLCIDYD